MIRHPLLRAAQSVAASAAIALVAVRPAPAANVRFSLAAMGERERPDGSWEGVDLLRGWAEPIDRFQLTLTPDTDLRARVEAQAADGSWEPLYQGTLAGHRQYALPAPHSFFGVQGEVRVRVTLSRIHAPATEPQPAVASTAESGQPLPLSDGSPFRPARVRYSADRTATFELQVHGR
ncbi:MAG: hypothetical protein ACJ784_20890 [Myxococcales bacterium]